MFYVRLIGFALHDNNIKDEDIQRRKHVIEEATVRRLIPCIGIETC